MTQPARSSQACREPIAAFSLSDIRFDVEVLADRHEALAALSPLNDDPPEDEPQGETDDAEEEVSDDLPF